MRAFYASLAEGDLPAVLAALGDDITWYEAPGAPHVGAAPYRGAVQVAERVLGPITAAVPDLAVDAAQFIDLGATTAAVGTHTGTAPGTRQQLEVGFIHVWHTDGVRLAEFRQYTDAEGFTRLVDDRSAKTRSRRSE